MVWASVCTDIGDRILKTSSCITWLLKLLFTMPHLVGLNLGGDIVRKALRIPCYTIALNAGVDAQDVVTRVMSEKQEVGYDALNGQYVDMIKSGIIDPTKVRILMLLLVSVISIIVQMLSHLIVIVNLYSASSGEAPQRHSRPNKTKP